MQRLYPRILSGFLSVILLAACAPADDGSGTEQSDTGDGQQADNAQSASAPDSFAETAWLVRSEDGARFVTHFDADGTYRDFRNGDPYQQGEWSYAEGPQGKQLCFAPQAENGVERCWVPGRIRGDIMEATGPGGRRIELQRAQYEAPEDEGEAEE